MVSIVVMMWKPVTREPYEIKPASFSEVNFSVTLPVCRGGGNTHLELICWQIYTIISNPANKSLPFFKINEEFSQNAGFEKRKSRSTKQKGVEPLPYPNILER